MKKDPPAVQAGGPWFPRGRRLRGNAQSLLCQAAMAAFGSASS